MDSGTFQLVMGRGPEPGKVYELPRSAITLGRDPGNTVSVNDTQVSRQHARIIPHGGLLVIEDLGSTNGTTINGVLVDAPYQLAHGDEIGLGDNVSFIFYGRFAGAADRTLASQPAADVPFAPRPASARYEAPPAYEPAPPAYQPAPPAYEPARPAYQPAPPAYEPARPAYEPAPPAYGPPQAAPMYADYPVYEQGRDWNRTALGCLAVAVVGGLILTILLYFFAPYGFWKGLEDFLQALGLNVQITKEALVLFYLV